MARFSSSALSTLKGKGDEGRDMVAEKKEKPKKLRRFQATKCFQTQGLSF
ncbi:uncharacterized protein STEHIDRAFT_164159 [Stereum hirsutum FP-91666 SS1]|uniref:Uncharacterized protein n=1 Tax=Stereum hirsutum (strain FP-91666) TaxID=721885 RepID=R7RW08_STEHR|nr:uncharacterized protein STEHIDRAFT_164159 [Stereum hirsutum FP-91666 SS1]EIM78960.1 hypothetical protein STEHIDRAFT_164159 [Stereum hirsutum FP-91666 SS1]